MRIRRARFLVPISAAAMLFTVSLGVAQRGGSSGGTTTPAPGKGTPSPTPTPTPTPTPSPTPSTQTPTTGQASGPIWIMGQVQMYDGGPPPESVTIERVCGAKSARGEASTDSKGRFSFQLGQNNALFADASNEGPGQLGGFGSGISGNGASGGTSSGASDTSFWDCDLRARLAGFRSDSIPLAQRRTLDNPDVGLILLYPIANIQGLTASATSGQAPRDARKAYEKGLDALKKNKPDQADQEFRKAVELYPRYAAAWLELGKSMERREQYPEARQAYASALAADSKYVYPYQQLYQLALREQNWKDLADKTEQLLHLDPYEFPAAYYYNAVAHFKLKEYDAAENSAHQAVDADRKHENPKTHYLLGAILVQKHDWTAATASLQTYLKTAPNAPEKAEVEKILGQIDQQISGVRAGSQDSPAQQ